MVQTAPLRRDRSGGRGAPRAAYGVDVRCAVVLFTRDLRVHDNPALAGAVRDAERVVSLFVREEWLLASSERRTALLDEALADLDSFLRRAGGALVVRQVDVVAEAIRVAREVDAEAVISPPTCLPTHRRESGACARRWRCAPSRA
jgi:deoxyribodipyrimidine photo-lyase